MKKMWQIFRMGLIALIPLFIIILVGNTLWGLFGKVTIKLVENSVRNVLLNFSIWIIFIFLAGWLLGMAFVRNGLKLLFSRIPLIGSISNYFLDSDSMEIIKNNDFPLVLFEHPGSHCVLYGLVTKEDTVIFSDGRKEIWCAVFYPTTPVPVTGFVFYFPKNYLIYTGSKAGFTDLVKVATSFGMKGSIIQHLSSKPAK